MRSFFISVVGVILLARPALADVIFFTNQSAFNAAATTSLVETFEAIVPTQSPIPSFSSNGITYTGFAGTPFPNVYIATAGFTNFSVVPITSNVLTANGDEDITLDLASPKTAIG